MAKLLITKKEDIDNIIKLYQNGNSCTKISKMHNTTGNTISALLKRNNIDVINKQNLKRYKIEDIIKDYCEFKISITQISKKYKSSSTKISSDLKKYGIVVENFHNKSKFNEHIFDIIDTEEKAYWLGFIFADGYISSSDIKGKNKYQFELSLSGKDASHLLKFNKFVSYVGNNVKFGNIKLKEKTFTRCRWSVSNKHLWETLNAYGCTPKKSLTLTFPDKNIFTEQKLIIPFIRGYFDGDGCVYELKGKSPSLAISVLGTTQFLNPIVELFFPRNLTKNHDKNNVTYMYALNRRQAFVFLYVIYYNASIYLNRKYQKFYNWKNCRSAVKAVELLKGKIGESCDANPELTYFFKKNK